MMAVMRFCLRPRAGRSAHNSARAPRSLATSYLYIEVTRRRPLEPRLLYGSNPFLRTEKIAAMTFLFMTGQPLRPALTLWDVSKHRVHALRRAPGAFCTYPRRNSERGCTTGNME